jgi:glycosyltransferase involved in cell wall biosynthesis
MSTEQRMTIGIDARMYGPKQTGIGMYIRYLITNLYERYPQHHYVLFVSPEGEADIRRQFPSASVVVSSCRWYTLCEQTIFLMKLWKEKVDVMHFPHFNVPILYRRPFVVTIHDIIPLLYPGSKIGKSWIRRKCFYWVFQSALSHARAIIAVSENTKKDVCERFSVSPEKIRVVYEGVPHIADNTKARSVRPTGAPYILYTGVLREHKNVSGLVRAFIELVRGGRDLRLVVVGPVDRAYGEPRRLWEEAGLSGRVTVKELLTDEELGAVFAGAAVVAVPSFYEGFGFVGLEAMSYGVPVVASRVASLPEILGDAALYFDPHNTGEIAAAISAVLDDPSVAGDLIAKGRKRIERFSWQRMIDETINIYGIIQKDA